MARVLSPDELAYAINAYESGMSVKKVARKIGTYSAIVLNALAVECVKIRSRSESQYTRLATQNPAVTKARAKHASSCRRSAKKTAAIPVSEMLAMYDRGDPVKSIADRFGVDASSIVSRLKANGRKIRTLGEQQKIRWSRMSDSDRVSMMTGAHKASRGRKRSDSSNEAAAVTRFERQTHIGASEERLAIDMKSRGLTFLQQFPIGPYNLDFAFEESLVAVEVECGNWGKPRPVFKYLDRMKYIFDRGWRVLIVFTQSTKLLFPDVTDKIIAFRDVLGGNKPIDGQYGVIRGDGKRTVPVSCYLHDFARIDGF